MSHEKINLELSLEQALVFFDWLCRFNKIENNKFNDQAEQRILWDIEAMLESILAEPLVSDYDVLLTVARSKVRDRND